MNTALDEFVKQEARAKAKEILMALVLDGKIAIADAAEELHIPEPELLQEFAPIIASELDARTRKGKTLGNQRTSKACNGTNVPKTVLDEYVDEQIAERQGKHVERLALDFILKGKISLADAAESLELPKAELLREFAALLTASNTGDAKGRISQKEQDMAKGNQSTPQSPEEMIQNQWILDNIMVPLFFDSKSAEAGDALQEILRTLLHDPKLVVVEHHPEDTMSNMGFHGIRIDVKARDGYGRQLALELQKESDEEIYPRAVFEGATMTVHSLNYGEPYDNIDK